jgi:hypothetical protein
MYLQYFGPYQQCTATAPTFYRTVSAGRIRADASSSSRATAANDGVHDDAYASSSSGTAKFCI